METVLTFARSELRKYYKKTTGADACEIELGIEPSLLEKGDDVKSDDRFRISVLAGKGKIVGINGRSVLLGVYRFFRELGWVFVRPGADGEKGVRKSAEECGVNLAFRPHYRFRTVTIEGANSVEDVIGLIDWSMKNGFNSYFLQFRDSHTFFERWYNHERNEYAAKGDLSFNDSAAFVERIVGEIKKRGMLYHAVGHGWTCECLSFPSKGWNHVKDEEITPDKRKYLAKVGGKRKFYLDTPLYSQLCYSDPKVRELIAEEVVSYIEKHGEIDYLHVWLGDNYNNFCECESCRQKIPTDWYFMILNEIDRRLSALKKDTKIVFLIYFELLWPSQTVVLKNPDRFVLMFAPITRTYAHGFLKEGEEADKELPVPQFELNKIVFPSSTKENLAFLFAHQKTFHGDCFDFDYHLMWEPYKDLGGLRIASVVYDDVRSLESLGMDGLASCQVQKVFMPHGFGMFVMGRTLEDPSLSLEGLKEEYFGALYSSHEKGRWKFSNASKRASAARILETRSDKEATRRQKISTL